MQAFELDAWYASAYGLSGDELICILDSAEIVGPNYPSLNDNEMRKHGDYRTARLVLAAWDRMEAETRIGVPA